MTNQKTTGFVFADIESTGPVPGASDQFGNPAVMTEFGLVDYATKASFHGVLYTGVEGDPSAPALPVMRDDSVALDAGQVARNAERFLKSLGCNRTVMVSDNPGFDAPWLNVLFHTQLGYSPFGYSSRRIGDYFAGAAGQWGATSSWKKLRDTAHTHNPVDDCMGNVEAVAKLASAGFCAGLPATSWGVSLSAADHRFLDGIADARHRDLYC